MFYVYLLENQDDKSWYIGFTSDLRRRIQEHQEGKGGKIPIKHPKKQQGSFFKKSWQRKLLDGMGGNGMVRMDKRR